MLNKGNSQSMATEGGYCVRSKNKGRRLSEYLWKISVRFGKIKEYSMSEHSLWKQRDISQRIVTSHMWENCLYGDAFWAQSRLENKDWTTL